MKLFEHALVLGGINGLYRVETEDGILLCRGASKIRKNGLKLMAGDRVTAEDNGDDTGFIREVDPRINSLVRPPI
ncbi:MAG: ribosome biogenesis GTPase RsgA, partial [Clostridia bacterium]|nr:ribosome biogenesis GTPase RsgA [Clostridia bacterium]